MHSEGRQEPFSVQFCVELSASLLARVAPFNVPKDPDEVLSPFCR